MSQYLKEKLNSEIAAAHKRESQGSDNVQEANNDDEDNEDEEEDEEDDEDDADEERRQ